MWYSAHNSNQFLSWYNKIDKYLSNVLWLKKYVPYGEKVDIAIQQWVSWSQVLDQYQSKFLYFGELRNQLVHGFSLDQKHFLEVSTYAVQQISRLYEWLTTPKTVWEIFVWSVFSCDVRDSLQEVIITMRSELNTHVPVYDKWMFIEMLSESTIAYRVADHLATSTSTDVTGICVWDVSLENTNDSFVFIRSDESIYDARQRFLKHSAQKKRLWALFITDDGTAWSPIIWIITAMDIHRIMKSSAILDI